MMTSKLSRLAGTWYPAGAAPLRAEVDGLLRGVAMADVARPLAGLVVPHAGYQYSGRAAATGYRRLAGGADRRALILAPSHYSGFRGGVGTAQAIARAYSVFATGGKELGIREETLRQLMAPAVPPTSGFRDQCLKSETQYSLGFAKPCPGFVFGHPDSFGFPGSGGSFGFADPHAKIGYAYVMNQMRAQLTDPRD